MHPGQLWDLPQRLSRAVHEFVFDPGLHLHAQRAAHLLPEGLSVPRFRTGSRTLMERCGLSPQVELDFDQPLHRMALLPADALALVARRASWTWHVADLQRVVLKTEVEALTSQLQLAPQDWEALNEQAPAMASNTQELPRTPRLSLDVLTTRIPSVGWQLIDAACQALPDSVASRIRLKLPVWGHQEVMDHSPRDLSVMVAKAYEWAVAQWDPQWERLWTEALAVPLRRRA